MTSEEVESYSDFVEHTFDYVVSQDNVEIDRDKQEGQIDSLKAGRVSGFSGDYTTRTQSVGEYSDNSYALVETSRVLSDNASLNHDQTYFNFGQVEDGFIAGAHYKVDGNTVSGAEFRIDKANPTRSVISTIEPSTARGL
ncbi:MAG: hypothetical protein KC800_30230 [Candidatus Eremiobacteraeota bacterium]|nr:hypothetical protein [Candidatus Eremiobacteraeota bacterium]